MTLLEKLKCMRGKIFQKSYLYFNPQSSSDLSKKKKKKKTAMSLLLTKEASLPFTECPYISLLLKLTSLGQTASVQILALPLTSRVTFSNLYNLPVPQFPRL